MPTETSDAAIVCKPTPWFLFRAAAMLLMFGVFATLFFIDGSTGYRKKNVEFYLYKTFEIASKDFTQRTNDGTVTPASWKAYAAKQNVKFPEDPYVLPKGFKQPVAWPVILQDYDKMKSTQFNLLWQEYSGEHGYSNKVDEHDFPRQKIREQWIFACICAGLAAVTAFFLLRTLRRSIRADGQGVTSQDGKRVSYADLKVLDLRKWDTKGLAFADYEGAAGKGRIRIDGLTYGGFKKEQDQPAEQLMQKIRSHFSGEIIEYTVVSDEEGEKAGEPEAKSDSAED